MNIRPRPVLIVDDDELDIRAFKRSLKKVGFDNIMDLCSANDGEEALNLLQQTSGPKRPILVVLDLNMPGMDGFEFLAALRKDEELRRAMVFVLTSSDHPSDKERAYSFGVAGYLLKGEHPSQLNNIAELIGKYVSTVRFPTDTSF